jgi:hypothetical protein
MACGHICQWWAKLQLLCIFRYFVTSNGYVTFGNWYLATVGEPLHVILLHSLLKRVYLVTFFRTTKTCECGHGQWNHGLVHRHGIWARHGHGHEQDTDTDINMIKNNGETLSLRN